MVDSPAISRRQLLAGAAGLAATGLPMIGLGSYTLGPSSSHRHSKRAIDLVRESLVIDMLAPLKIDLTPDFYSSPLSEQDAARHHRLSPCLRHR